MKLKKIQKKLSLNKKTVAALNKGSMKRVLGGETFYCTSPKYCLDPSRLGC